MSVSSLTRHAGDKNIYVQFACGNATAEFTFPGFCVLRSSGFTEEELKQLIQYMDAERETIYSLAKQVNPLKAFMGQNGADNE